MTHFEFSSSDSAERFAADAGVGGDLLLGGLLFDFGVVLKQQVIVVFGSLGA